MDYRIFNVRTSSFLSLRIHTVRGGWAHHTDSESPQHFSLAKTLTTSSCAPDAGGVPTSALWISSPTLYPLSHPVTLFLPQQEEKNVIIRIMRLFCRGLTRIKKDNSKRATHSTRTHERVHTHTHGVGCVQLRTKSRGRQRAGVRVIKACC